MRPLIRVGRGFYAKTEQSAKPASGKPGAVHCLSSSLPCAVRLWRVLGLDRWRKKPRSTTEAQAIGATRGR
jgi:hypothetical protein